MTDSTYAVVAALSLLTAGCDRKPVPSKLEEAAPQTVAKTGAADVEPATPQRRFIDVHTHLNAFSYDTFFDRVGPLGVVRVVNLSGGSSPERRADNLTAAEQHPGQVMLFHNIDWDQIDDPDFGVHEAARLEASVRAGFAGLKVSKALGLGVRTADGELVPVDDPRLDPIWAKAGELGVPVAIHTADPKAFFEPPTPDNERYAELSLAPGWSFYGDEFPSRAELLAERDRMVARHPETTFILVHLANNPEDPDYVDALLAAHPNVVVDIAARIAEFGRHDATRMRAFFEKYADRVLFGTDIMLSVIPVGQTQLRLTLGSISQKRPGLDDIAPFYMKHFQYFEQTGAPIEHPVPIQGAWKVHPVGLDSDTLDQIYWANAERIVAAPWLGRGAASQVAAQAAKIIAP